jgi:L-lactate dehydrogenase
MTSKIAIVGVGHVGGCAANALLLGSICGELLLVDINIDFRDGQVRDLSDATYRENSSTRVRAGTYKEAGQCDIVIITAGTKRTRGKTLYLGQCIACANKNSIGETSLELVYRNTSMLRSVINAMKPFRSDTILLVVSNPVDVLTSFAQELSGLPKSQVLGCGTFLETARLRGLMADKIGVRIRCFQDSRFN